MKTTAKFRRALQAAILDEMCKAIDYHCPEIADNPPETWDSETKARFDLITDVEAAMSKALNKALDT